MKNLLLFPLLFLSLAQAETIQCKVNEVISGDTIKCLTDDKKQNITVSLIDIDAPGLDQPYGAEAKKTLSSMVLNQNIALSYYDETSHKSYISICSWSSRPEYDNDGQNCGIDAGLSVIRQGYAWATSDKPSYQQANQEAREAKRGLWADLNPIPPWEWRKARSNGQAVTEIDVEYLKKLDFCVNFPTKLNPDGCSTPRKSKAN